MVDRPILFSGAMVQALLAGSKTQTRRVLKPQPQEDIGLWMAERDLPYAVGDRLWVRETWKPVHSGDPSRGAQYRADRGTDQTTWKPGIHMFRWASRLTLTVTEVRVQRLHDINLKDARAEGCEIRQMWLFGPDQAERDEIGRDTYRALWDSINGSRPGCAWAENPFVVAVSFSIQRRNIDA